MPPNLLLPSGKGNSGRILSYSSCKADITFNRLLRSRMLKRIVIRSSISKPSESKLSNCLMNCSLSMVYHVSKIFLVQNSKDIIIFLRCLRGAFMGSLYFLSLKIMLAATGVEKLLKNYSATALKAALIELLRVWQTLTRVSLIMLLMKLLNKPKRERDSGPPNC